MMECDSCGANLNLKMATCPYCGAPNLDAIDHIHKLKFYQDKYQDTKDSLIGDVEEKAPLRTKRIILSMEIVLFILVLIVGAASYEINEFFDYSRAKLHAKSNLSTAYAYMENYDALSLANDRWINDNKKVKASEIELMWKLSDSYTKYQTILLCIADDNPLYYGGLSQMISSSAYNLRGFTDAYDEFMSDDYLAASAISEENYTKQKDYVEGLKARLDALLVYHIGIPADRLEEFYAGNDTERAKLISDYSPYTKQGGNQSTNEKE